MSAPRMVSEREAGRALDALIAEKVMGWRWIAHTDPVDGCVAHFRHVGADALVADGEYGWRLARPTDRHVSIDLADIPAYSTDIAAAWLVQEKLQESEWELSLDYEAPKGVGGQGWCATLGHHEKDAVFAYAKTAPLAICHAALLAVSDDVVSGREP